MNNTGAPQGDELGRMKPLSWISLSCPNNSSNSEGSELTLLAGSELKTSELDTSELKTSEYRFLKIFILASYEQNYQQCIRLYCRGKENGVNILKSIDEGPFLDGRLSGNPAVVLKCPHLGLKTPPVYFDLSPEDRKKDIWDNVKMLLEGSELTKEDQESQLYDDFEHFCQNKGETIHDYYVHLPNSSMTYGTSR
ncbi:hypothetical protein Tco_0010986 [Tanacetum coccineum]